MELQGGFALGRGTALAVSRILLDAVREPFGAALPRTAEQLARPEVIDALLREHAPAGAETLPASARYGCPASTSRAATAGTS